MKLAIVGGIWTGVLIISAILVIAIIVIPYQQQEASASLFDNLAKLFNPNPTPSIMDGFSLYEDSIHKASIQYPSNWDKHQIFNNDYVGLVMFVIPSGIPPVPQNMNDKAAMAQYTRDITTYPDKVIFSVKSLPVETIPTLRNVTSDQVKTLGFRFDNFSLLSTSYDTKMGDIPASKTVYMYTDNGTQKKGMQVNAVQGYKQITLEYSSIPQDFDKFLPTIFKMINSFQPTS